MAHVSELWLYPVKSMQGLSVASLELDQAGVAGDRRWALIDANSKLCSAKRYSKLFEASASADGTITLSGGDIANSDEALSEWLGTSVKLVERAADTAVGYEMTFEPPNDEAEYYEIPSPIGTFLDLAGIHIVAASTLAYCAEQYPDLDWDVRRFRPNIVIDVDIEPFAEDAWSGSNITIGDAVIHIDMPSVRCAMPLRGQPGGLQRQPAMYAALDVLHNNHLGLYATVVQPARINVGDMVVV